MNTEPLFDSPPGVTPYGAIAYRINDVATDLALHGDSVDDATVSDLARKLWGIVDDLVALNMESADG
jgi:hypothetical protein